MQVHRLKPESLPVIRFAHENESENHRTYFEKTENFLEITFREKNDVHVLRGGVEETIPEGAVVCTYRDAPFSVWSEGAQRHVTVGVDMKLTVLPTDAADETSLLLPHFVLLPNREKYRNAIYAITEEYTVRNGTTPKLSAMILSLLADLSADYQHHIAGKVAFGEQRYAEKAKQYVAAHLREKIRVGDVAEAVGLSIGYLCNVFRRATGQTLIEYVNMAKLRRVRELMETYSVTKREAGEAVGLTDENYVSRMYRRYFGKNISGR